MNNYAPDGQGLVRWEKEGEYFFHTQFEVFHAHKAFPCFDQPDLKATYEFTCFADPDLTIVSNELAETISRIGEGNWESYMDSRKIHKIILSDFGDKKPLMHIFRQTQQLSTYLFGLCAGKLVSFSLPKPIEITPEHRPCVNVYCRPPIAEQFMPTSELFLKMTKGCIEFLSEYFDLPYQYSKCDIILVPGFKYEGMENCGCIVIDEIFVNDLTDWIERNNILTHEIVHHWIGNLVTMKWWSNTWLNEAFTVFIGHIAIERSSGFESLANQVWSHMADLKRDLYDKEAEYKHGLIVPNQTTKNAENIVDGVTYDKGAGILLQMYYMLGFDCFRDIMRKYVKDHKGKNTVPEDFWDCFDYAVKKHGKEKDVELFRTEEWKKKWFELYWNNAIYPEWEVDKNTDNITKFYVKQIADEDGIFRDHMVRFALYYYGADKFEFIDDIRINAAEATEIKQMEGRKAPLAVYINADDWAYVKTLMDPVTEGLVKSGGIALADNSLTYILMKDNVHDWIP